MIHVVIQSSIILFLALCAVRVFRGQSAATRHAILTAGLVSSLAAPFVGPVLPEGLFIRRAELYETPQERTEIFGNISVALRTEPPATSVSASSHPFRWIWFGGMAIAGAVLVAGLARIARLLFRSKIVVDPRWIRAATETAHLLRLKRRVQLLHNQRAVLGTWGILRPKLFLPRDAETWPDERICIVLMHELAHIRRFDWPVQILAEIGRIVYWFNPLFWLACRQLRSESEHACDDAVLNAGFDARNYAAHLLDIARTLRDSDRDWPPVLAMSRPPHLERRFLAMLNPSLNHRSVTLRVLIVTCAAAVGATLAVAGTRAPEQTRPPAVSLKPSTPSAPAVLKPAAPPASPVSSKPAARKPATSPSPQGRADGSLFGTIFDGSGAVVPGVRVTVSSLETVAGAGIRENPVSTSITNEIGEFQFQALVPGRYSLMAELSGFTSFRKAEIEIKPSEAVRETVFLSIGKIVERVAVTAAGQPRAPVPPGTPRRIRVGGYVVAANLISQVKPIYPQSARDAGIEGTVHLEGIIGADGSFLTLRVLGTNDKDLANAALEAVKQWRYRPALLNNEPIEVLTDVDVQFMLAQ